MATQAPSHWTQAHLLNEKKTTIEQLHPLNKQLAFVCVTDGRTMYAGSIHNYPVRVVWWYWWRWTIMFAHTINSFTHLVLTWNAMTTGHIIQEFPFQTIRNGSYEKLGIIIIIIIVATWIVMIRLVGRSVKFHCFLFVGIKGARVGEKHGELL